MTIFGTHLTRFKIFVAEAGAIERIGFKHQIKFVLF